MVETLRYTKLYTEDLDIGTGRREVVLADGRVALLTQINLGNLLLTLTAQIVPANGFSSESIALFPAKARAFGATLKILTALGASASLTTLSLGDPMLGDRWGSGIARAELTETDQDDFTSEELPIYHADTNVILAADAGTFDGTGLVEITSHFMMLSHKGLS